MTADLVQLLADSGVSSLDGFSSVATVTESLRTYVAELNGAGALDAAAARAAALRELKAHKVRDGYALVVAAFQERGAKHSADAGAALQGQGVALADPEPWPEPVAGAGLLDELAATFAHYVALPDGAAAVLALWTLHAHAHAAAAISPILALTSPERRCGKSTTLHLLSALVPRPLPASSISPAALFRAVERYTPALLLDEADTVFGPKGNEDLRCILNAAHMRAGAVVIRTVGDDFEPRTFSTWCPKAVALIGELPATLADRALVLRMRRRRADEQVAKLRLDRLSDLEPLRRQAWRWGQDQVATLKVMDPPVPDELHDRAADNWRPLLAIADACGGPWPERARAAARILAGVTTDADGAPGVQLLGDVRALFAERGVDRLSSADVVEALVQREDRPWPEWHGRPLTKRGLARVLGRFGIAPKKIRLGTGVLQGYQLDQFGDTFSRYLPRQAEHLEQASSGAAILGAAIRNGSASVPDAQPTENPHEYSSVPDVPDAEGGSGGGGRGDAWDGEGV
jgi:putative DNA primase/helicase